MIRSRSTNDVELTGRYLGERYRFDNPDGSSIIIGSLSLAVPSKPLAEAVDVDPDSPIAIKGPADIDELEVGMSYSFSGQWKPYRNPRTGHREQQFHFRLLRPHIPHDRDSVIEYLSATGRGNGVGPSKAMTLVDHYGPDVVLHVCRTDPTSVSQLVRIRMDQAESLMERLMYQHATESSTLEVDKLLHGRGFRRTLTRQVIKKFKNHAAKIITDDPYCLLNFRGVGTGLADKLWIGLGKDPYAVERQAILLWYSMHDDNDGHVWFEATDRAKQLHRAIGSGHNSTGQVDMRAAIIKGKEYAERSTGHYGAITTARSQGKGGPLCAIGEDGCDTLWLAESENAAAEQYVATAIAKAQAETFAQQMTTYEDVEHRIETVLKYGRCHRCSRQLTAETVHVLDGVPYGPTCIGYVDPEGRHEVYALRDYLEANPIVQRWIEQQPGGVIRLPEISLWPDPDDVEGISEHQREGLRKALTGRIALLGGSPGTGKTWTIAALIKAIHKTGRVGLHEIGIHAPTGRAAGRLTKSLAKHGIVLTARTCHSLLGVGEIDDTTESPDWTFKHNERNPWSYKIIIADEQSMPDINLMAAVFKARGINCHMLFSGDIYQLPPVGKGKPFYDMIDAGLPYGELTEIQRNSGGIVEACAAIRDGKPWVHEYLDGTKNLHITGDRTPKEQIAKMHSLIKDYQGEGYDPVWVVQVITAVNNNSELSRKALNRQLQDALNPNPIVDGTPFRLADKVVCLENGDYKIVTQDYDTDFEENDRGEVRVANGELGEIVAIEDKFFDIRLEGSTRVIQVPRGQSKETIDGDDNEKSVSTGCSWDLGYALSVHKFQGSEQKIVIAMLDSYYGAKQICDQSWMITSISRAQIYCELVGTEAQAEQFCRHWKLPHRKTFLANRIRLAQFELEPVRL